MNSFAISTLKKYFNRVLKSSILNFFILFNVIICRIILIKDIIRIGYEVKKYQNLLNCAINGTQINKRKFKKYHNPKISIIISVYNREKFIKSTLTSIQNQKFQEIEIIYVDDFSTDNSINLIKHEMKTDQRIVLYKNKENMGNLFTKSLGAKNAKRKYIISLDSDYMLLIGDILSTLYKETIKNSLDIIQFDYLKIYRYLITKKMFIKKKNYRLDNPKDICDMYKFKNKFSPITAKLINTHIYKKALELLGEDIKMRIN